MPKLSRRRRQLKEMQSSSKKDYIYVDNDDDDDGDNESDESANNRANATAENVPKKPKRNRATNAQALSTASHLLNNEKELSEDEKPWVQCNSCDKWRQLPKDVDVDALPDLWTCSMNIWDPNSANCDVPEEKYELVDEELKSFCRLWTKRLKNTDKAEAKLPSSTVTRGKKRSKDGYDYIQCQNPSCMKWRAITVRGLDYASMFHKLNTKGKVYLCKVRQTCSYKM